MSRVARRAGSIAILCAALAAMAGAAPPVPGGRIAVVCFNPDPLGYQICTLSPDGTGYRQLTHGPERLNSTDPELSPDGTHIVFVRGQNDGKTDTFVMNADGTDVRQLTHCRDCYGEDTPTYSPDGRTIAFHRDPRTSRGGVFLMNADGSRVRQLTRETCDCYDGQASYAPDGRRLVFARYENPTHRGALFTATLDGKPPRQITPWALGAAYPDWSPNGALIVFSSHSNDGLRAGRSRNLYTVHPDGSGLRALTTADDGIEQDYQPSWSPDGQWIAFTRESNAQATPGIHGDANLDVMRADGSDIRRIAAPPRGGRTVDWGVRARR